MAWYSSDRRILRRQVALDVGFACWVAIWVVVSLAASSAIRGLTGPLRSAVRSVEALRDNIHQAAVGASGLPVGGGALHPPLDAASTDANGLVAALNDQIRAIELAATGTGVALVVVPLLLFLCWWLPRRLRTSRARGNGDSRAVAAATPRATAVERAQAGRELPAAAGPAGVISAGQRLAALRTLVSADPEALLALSDDPVGDWARGDADIVRELSQWSHAHER